MGENLQNYEVVLTETRYLCYYVEAESEQVAIDEVTTAYAEGDEGYMKAPWDSEITDKVAHVMEQY